MTQQQPFPGPTPTHQSYDPRQRTQSFQGGLQEPRRSQRGLHITSFQSSNDTQSQADHMLHAIGEIEEDDPYRPSHRSAVRNDLRASNRSAVKDDLRRKSNLSLMDSRDGGHFAGDDDGDEDGDPFDNLLRQRGMTSASLRGENETGPAEESKGAAGASGAAALAAKAAADKAAEEKAEAERKEAERVAAEQAAAQFEAQRLAAEKADAERRETERIVAAQAAAEAAALAAAAAKAEEEKEEELLRQKDSEISEL